MKIKKLLSLLLATFLTASSISHVVASEQAVVEEVSQEPVTVNAEATAVQNHTILEGTSLGNTYHRLNKETVTDETGFTYIKLTPTTQALVPKVDRYALNMSVGEYNYMKVMYKTTVEDSIPFFNIMNGTGITLLEGFKPSPANEWVSAIIAINTTDNAVLNQYHFSIFGETLTANNLQGEEFCLGYIGFFKYYDDAVNYQSDISGTILATEGLGEAYCITSDVFANNLDKLTGADNSFTFSYDATEDALKATGGSNPAVGKIQFNASALTGIPFVKDEYNYVKVRYKYNITYDDRQHSASLREGYTTESTLHSLYSVPTNMNNVWYENIAPITWGTAAENYDTLTFIPMWGAGIFSEDYVLIDYISFFKTETEAEAYGNKANDSIIMTAVDFTNAEDAPFDPDGILSFSDTRENDGSYKMTFNARSTTGKMQFNVNEISGKSLCKDVFKFMKIRYKHKLSGDTWGYSYFSSLREGYSAESSLHSLFELGAYDTWHEEIVEIDWGTSADANNVLTFHPIRAGGCAEIGDTFYIDYIGFFMTEEDAESFVPIDKVTEDNFGDSFEAATPVEENKTKFGSLYTAEDIDYFKFVPDKSGYYSFATSGTLDTFLRLYNQYEENFQYSDNASSDNLNFYLEEYLYSGTTYYFTIHSKAKSVGNYRLNVNYVTPEVTIGFGNSTYNISSDGTLTIPVVLSGISSQNTVTSLEFTIIYDNTVFDFSEYGFDFGSAIYAAEYPPIVSHDDIENTGVLCVKAAQCNISQPGTILELIFDVVSEDFSKSNITIENIKLYETNSGYNFILDAITENTVIDAESQNIYTGNPESEAMEYSNASAEVTLFDESEKATIDTAYYGDINADGVMNVSDLAWIKANFDAGEIDILDFIILDVIDAKKLSMLSTFNYVIDYSFNSGNKYPSILKADGIYEKGDFITSLKIFEPLEGITTYQAAIDEKTRIEYDGMASGSHDIDWYSLNNASEEIIKITSAIPLSINIYENTIKLPLNDSNIYELTGSLAAASISDYSFSDGMYVYTFIPSAIFGSISTTKSIICVEAYYVEQIGDYCIAKVQDNPSEPEPTGWNLKILSDGKIAHKETDNEAETITEYIYKPELPENIAGASNIKYIQASIFGNIVVWSVDSSNYYNFGIAIPEDTQSKRVCAFSYICSNETLTSFYYSINFE